MELADVPRVLERLRTGPAAWGEVTCAFEGTSPSTSCWA